MTDKKGGIEELIRVLLADQWTWNVPLFVFFFALTGWYCFLLSGKRIHDLRKQMLCFLIGIWLLFFAIGSPLLAISHLSFSFHMIQMSIVFFIIPPLILFGIPEHLYSHLSHWPTIKRLRFMFPTPKTALLIFAMLFLLYHFPYLLQIITEYELFHKIYVIILFLLAIRMWWPIATPDPEQRLIGAKRKKYLLESSWYIMPACLMFIISAWFEGMNNPFLDQTITHLCLPPDSTIDVLPPPFNTRYDQMIAGVAMMGLHKFSLFTTTKLKITPEKD